MPELCPRCHLLKGIDVGWYTAQVAIDDAVDIIQFLCLNCDYEWEN